MAAQPAAGRSHIDGAVSMLRSVWNDAALRVDAALRHDDDDEWAPPSPPPCEPATCWGPTVHVEEQDNPLESGHQCGASRSRFKELPRPGRGVMCCGSTPTSLPGATPGRYCEHEASAAERGIDFFGIRCELVDREETMRFDTDMPGSPGMELHEVTLEYRWDELVKATGGFAEPSVVGGGGCGTVFRGVLEEGLPVAAKVLHNSSGEGFASAFEEEVRLLARCHHPNIAMLMGFAKDSLGSGRRALVYELLPNGSAFSRLHSRERPFTWQERLRTAVEANRGLAHMLRLTPEVFHGDIRSSNILFDKSDTAKIADFRLACCAAAPAAGAPGGTLGYAAPELESVGTTQATEVFAMGVVLLELLSRQLPAAPTADGTGHALLCDEVRPEDPVASQRVLALLDQSAEWPSSTVGGIAELAPKCVHCNPRRRPTFAEMLAVLQACSAAATPPAEAGGSPSNGVPSKFKDWEVDAGAKSPAPRKNRLNLMAAYSQGEPDVAGGSPAKSEARETGSPAASPVRGLEPAREAREDPALLARALLFTEAAAGEARDGAEDSRAAPAADAVARDASAADVLAAAVERMAHAQQGLEMSPRSAAGPRVALQRLARGVSDRLGAASSNKGASEGYLSSSPAKAGYLSSSPLPAEVTDERGACVSFHGADPADQASGPLDGRWITAQQQKEATIDGEKVKWKSGKVWTIEADGGDLFSVTVAGVKYSAQLVGGELEWDDGDTWTRLPPEAADGAGSELEGCRRSSGLGDGLKQVRNAIGARLATTPVVAGGRAARDADSDGEYDDDEELRSDGEYDEGPNAAGRWKQFRGIVGAALGGAGPHPEMEQTTQLGARVLQEVGALGQRIQRIRPLDAVQTVQQTVQQKLLQGAGGPAATTMRGLGSPEEQRADEAGIEVAKEVTGSSTDQDPAARRPAGEGEAQTPESCHSSAHGANSEKAEPAVECEASKLEEPDYAAITASLRLHHISDFTE